MGTKLIMIYGLYDDIKFECQVKIWINTGSSENLIKKARKERTAYLKYKELLSNDYILYQHKDNISKFYKRESFKDIFLRKDLYRKNGVFYTLEKPEGRKVNPKTSKKLIVIFTSMPDKEHYDSSLVQHRMFPKFFDGIQRNLLKNVYIMRIMDLNVSHGSHYIKTINYPNYEIDIRDAIIELSQQLNIKKDNIVFYGVSKGGAGSIYHGSALDFKTLAVDPIVNIGGDLENNDRRFLKNLRKDDLVPCINENLENSSKRKKVIICSENVPLYFAQTNRITGENISIINLKDDNIKIHPDVSRNSVPEQLMILNMLLDQFDKNIFGI
ncbi:hypothetical protein ASS95_11030 [Staphylococcus equorum]|nr:hypothetical protein ASS95_11030 [Staphylococcus equorum]